MCLIIQVISALAQGFIVGSSCYNTTDDASGSFSRSGVCFFAALYVSLISLAEVPSSFNTRLILMKQRNNSMYYLSFDALAVTVSSIPVALIVTFLFVIVIYNLANLARDVCKFFIFFLFVFLLNLTISSLFRAVSALNKTVAAANTMAGLLMLALFLYSSIIQGPSMHPWLKWVSYINPLLYGFEAMIAIEFHGRKMQCDAPHLVPNGPGFQDVSAGEQVCSFIGSVPGQSWVSGDAYLEAALTFKFSHVWRNLGILLGFYILFFLVNAIAVSFVKPIIVTGDRLIFLRGKVPDTIVLPEQKLDSTVSAIPNSLEKNGHVTAVFEDLKSNDLLVWKDITCSISLDGAKRTVLDAVSGYCVPGTLTALMGESDIEKTTLLSILARRVAIGSGEVLVNGEPFDTDLTRRIGYVQQQDMHISEATVRESLNFSALLRRPNTVSEREKLEYVEKIIYSMDMVEYADALVGQSGCGLNLEQRKKLSIAIELVTKPSVLYLNEPTSGLDSQSAWAIIKMLRDLTNAGLSIICTMHQPSASLFEIFDRLLLLKKGGQTVYFGDIGVHSRTLLEYFKKYGSRECHYNENPAEFILEVIGADSTAIVDNHWGHIWLESGERQKTIIEGDRLLEEYSRPKSQGSISEYVTPWTYQLLMVLRRNASTFYRNPGYIWAKLSLMTISGLFIGFTFFGLKSSITGMQNAIFLSFLVVVVAAPLINQLQEQAIFSRELYETRERMTHSYHWSSMILSQFLNELPYCFFGAVLMFVSLYFPTQASSSGYHSGVFYLTFGIFFQMYYVSFGLMILYVAPDIPSAAVLVSFFYSFIVAFSGVVQPVRFMPGFWTFMYKASPYTYFIENLLASILYDGKAVCILKELTHFNPPSGKTCQEYAGTFAKQTGGYLTNPSATENCGYCAYSSANSFLKNLGWDHSHIWRNFGLFCAYIAFDVVAMLALYWLFRARMRSLIPGFLVRKKYPLS